MNSTSIYAQVVTQNSNILRALRKLLDKLQTHAETKKFNPANYLNARLAPDQFHFIRQVQICCDTAKFACARLAGKEAPAHEDKEQTIDELRTRIDKVLSYISTFSEKDFDKARDQKIVMSWDKTKSLKGEDYFLQYSIPNIYFHMTTAYDILRHNGLEIGKGDYLGEVHWEK